MEADEKAVLDKKVKEKRQECVNLVTANAELLNHESGLKEKLEEQIRNANDDALISGSLQQEIEAKISALKQNMEDAKQKLEDARVAALEAKNKEIAEKKEDPDWKLFQWVTLGEGANKSSTYEVWILKSHVEKLEALIARYRDEGEKLQAYLECKNQKCEKNKLCKDDAPCKHAPKTTEHCVCGEDWEYRKLEDKSIIEERKKVYKKYKVAFNKLKELCENSHCSTKVCQEFSSAADQSQILTTEADQRAAAETAAKVLDSGTETISRDLDDKMEIFDNVDKSTYPEFFGWGALDWIGVPLDCVYRLISPLCGKVHRKLEKKFGKAEVEIVFDNLNIIRDKSLESLDTITSYGYKWVSEQFDTLLGELLDEEGEDFGCEANCSTPAAECTDSCAHSDEVKKSRHCVCGAKWKEEDSASVTKEDVTNFLGATKKNLWDDRTNSTKWTFGAMLFYKFNGWYFTKYLFKLLGAACKWPLQAVGLDQYLPEMPQFQMPKFTLTPWNASDPESEKTSDGVKGIFQKIKSSPNTKYVAGGVVVAGLGLCFWKPIWRKVKSLFGGESSATPMAEDTTIPVSALPVDEGVSRSADPLSHLQESTGMDKHLIIGIIVAVIGVIALIYCIACRGRRSGRYGDEYSRSYDIEEGSGSRKRKSRLPSFWPKRSGRSYQPSGTPCSDRRSKRDEFISFNNIQDSYLP